MVYTASGTGSSGARLSVRPDAGVLRVGDGYTWTVRGCSGEDCSADSAAQTLVLDPLQGAGNRDSATYVDAALGDRLSAQVNVGSGNLLVSQQHFSLAGVTQDVAVGQEYNSLAGAPGSSNPGGTGTGAGWRTSVGQNLRLLARPGGAVTFYGPTGYVAQFTGGPAVGGAYTSPAGIDATLTRTSGGWTLAFHRSARTLTFDGGGQLLSDADRNGNTTTVAYVSGAPGRMASITGTRSGARTVTMSYTGDLRTGISQGSGATTRGVALGYDGAGQLTSVTDAAGGTTSYAYGPANQLTRITDPAGRVTEFAYDSRNRVTRMVRDVGGVGAVTTFAYTDGTNGRTVVTDPNGRATTYDIDYANRVTRTVDANGNVQSTTWTSNARVGTSTSGSGGTTTNTYGANNGESLTSTQSPLGARSSFAYPSSSGLSRYLPTSSTDSSGNTSTYAYSGPGNRTSTTNAEAAVASVTYNADGTVATSTDPGNAAAGARTTYTYTDRQLTGVAPPAGNSLAAISLTYDAFGRVRTVRTGTGVTRTYSYDALDRQTAVDHSDATPDVWYTYDRLGNLTARTDAIGATSFRYDGLNRLTGKDLPGPEDLAYGYDAVGNLVSSQDSGGRTAYAYDAVNNLTRLVAPDGVVTVFAYDADNLRTDTWTGGADPRSQFAVHVRAVFDRDQRLTELVTTRAGSDSTRVGDLAYSYNRPGTGARSDTRYAVTDRITGQATTYTYDRAMRLTRAETSGGPVYEYSYDADGNIVGGSPGAHSYNSANQLTDAGTAHDANGNLTAHPRLGASTYDGADLTTSVTPPGAGRQDLVHAGDSQDELVRVGSTTLVNGLLGVQSQTTPAGTTYFVRDPQGTLVSQRGPAGTQYHVVDGLGSVVALVGADGQVAATYSYDPYGARHTVNGPDLAAAEANPWRFAGGYRTVSGLRHFGARYYDAELGRWTQQDPLSFLTDPRDGNRYAYAGCNPINYTDPTGLVSKCAIAAGAGGLLGGAVGAGFGFAAGGGVGAAYGGGLGIGVVGGLINGACNSKSRSRWGRLRDGLGESGVGGFFGAAGTWVTRAFGG